MSFDVELVNTENKRVRVPSFDEGGIVALGGSDLAEINITYNYAKFFNFRGLHNRKVNDTIPELQEALMRLGTIKAVDYWQPTEGNTGHVIQILLTWATLNPNAMWKVY